LLEKIDNVNKVLINAMMDSNLPILDQSTLIACYTIGSQYFVINPSVPEGESMKATFSDEYTEIIETCFQWNPFVAASNGKPKVIECYLTVPSISTKLFQVRDEYGQTCLQKAIFCRHDKVVRLLITAYYREHVGTDIDEYLRCTDRSGHSHFDTAKDMGYSATLMLILEEARHENDTSSENTSLSRM
jgi:hypothetical protein